MKKLLPLLLLLASCTPSPPPLEPEGPLVFEGQYILDKQVAAAWCGSANDCQEEVGNTTYLVTSVTEHDAIIRGEGLRRIVPYDPNTDLCQTEFKGEICSPNFYITINKTPNDPMIGDQWGLQNIKAKEAWNIVAESNTTVAVVDTGIDCNHPELNLNCKGEHNAIDGTNNQRDDNGHGTHCAGIIGARGDNNAGIVGVAWRVPLLAVKFLTANGGGSLYDAIKAIDWSIANGAKVISASWGCRGCYSESLRRAIERANDSGILFIAASGNSGVNTDASPHYPSNYDLPNVISVGALTSSDRKASYSNYGASTVDLFAPGSSILSTWTGGAYKSISGTSMATPHVAGAAALLAGSGLSSTRIKEQIFNGVRPLEKLKDISVTGGTLDLLGALQDGQETPPCDEPGFNQCVQLCKEEFHCGTPVLCKGPQPWSGGSVWKPESESTGKLVVLLRSGYPIFESCKVKRRGGIWEKLQYTGTSNGDRQTYRGDFSGGSGKYAGKRKDGGVKCSLEGQTCFFPLPGPPRNRYE